MHDNSQFAPILVWFRRDLRLSDHPALSAAAATGRPIIPVFILDEVAATLGAAPRWRLGLALEAFARSLQERGSRLILRQGRARDVLAALIEETGARDVWWTRCHDQPSIERDTGVKNGLKAAGIGARSFPGSLLFEPWEVENRQGEHFKVYTPFWKAVADRDVASPLPAPARLPAPGFWPLSAHLEDWRLGAAMDRGAGIVSDYVCVGERAARDRLGAFIETAIDGYKTRRDYLAEEATSRLSENLTYGEIAPTALWWAGRRALEQGAQGAEHFLKEVVWREFAWHLAYHTPHITSGNWRSEWDAFPWQGDNPAAEAWRQGRTGVQLVDAAMREMYVTGTMHNRGRMVVASYLTKHLMTHWRVGQEWFEECLIDWDPAANALGWQWTAGSGPDAAPYFRIFNPDTQAERFDADGAYRRRFIAEIAERPEKPALAYFDAIPRSWQFGPESGYPAPVVTLEEGRARALAAYESRKLGQARQNA